MSIVVQIVFGSFGFIFIMTITLNFIDKDRILVIGEFFEKVLPRIPGIATLRNHLRKNKSNNEE